MQRRRLPPDPVTERIGAAYSAADLVLARAGAPSGRSPRRASRRSSCRTRSRPATTRRRTPSYFVRAGGAIMVRDLDLDDVPDHVRSLLDDPQRLARMGEAMLRGGAARRGRGDRRGADRACVRLRAAGSGSSASAAPGSRRTRSSRARGAPRWAAGIASRRRTSTPLGGVAVEIVARAGRARTAGRRSSRRRTRACPAASRAEFLAELVGLRRADRRRRHPRQGHDGGDDRVRRCARPGATRRG